MRNPPLVSIWFYRGLRCYRRLVQVPAVHWCGNGVGGTVWGERGPVRGGGTVPVPGEVLGV